LTKFVNLNFKKKKTLGPCIEAEEKLLGRRRRRRRGREVNNI
jgi:hypothetical protein